MAKATGPQLPMRSMQKTLHGRLYMRLHKGSLVVQSWPVARGEPASPVTKQQNTAFKRFVDAVKAMPDGDKVGAGRLAAGTTDTWRDVLSRVITGRLIEIDWNGQMPVQDILDAISNVVGAMLVRTDDGWAGLVPTDDGKVLVLVAGIPTWQALVIPPGGIDQLHGDVIAGPGTGDQAATLASTGVIAGTYGRPSLDIDAKGRITAASTNAQDINQLTGDITAGPGSGSVATTLSNSGVVAGSYTYASVTVDAKGRLTAASSGAPPVDTGITELTGDVTTASGSGSQPATLANTGVAAGTYTFPSFTVDAKGRLTNAVGGSGSGSTGYPAGTIPTVVQVAHNDSSTGATFASAPTSGNLLVAFNFNTSVNTAASGWTLQVQQGSGTDYGSVLTKVAGAGESTTQTPMNGANASSGTVIYELHGARATLPVVAALSQVEQGTQLTAPVYMNNLVGCLGLSALSVVGTTVTITTPMNTGTQDVYDNTGNRRMYAGHTDLNQNPVAGILAVLSAAGSSKSATCLISA